LSDAAWSDAALHPSSSAQLVVTWNMLSTNFPPNRR
jgi:hypothetical protein